MLDLIVLHGEFSLFTVRGNFWYQIYQNQRQKLLCQLMALITSQTIRPKNPCVCVCVCMYVCGKFPSGLIRKTVRVTGLVFSV